MTFIKELLKVINLSSGKINSRALISLMILELKFSGIEFNFLCIDKIINEIKIINPNNKFDIFIFLLF